MAACTIREGEGSSVEVAGDPKSKYIIAFDPSWAESDSSDDFAMHVFKLNDETKQGVLVHSYALAGTNLKHHIQYFHYLIKHFNIVSIVGDYNGGVQFINACNESSLFKKTNINIKTLTPDFDKPDEYQDELRQGKKEYSKEDRHYCVLRKPTSQWIRRANELLQGNFDHKRIWFASRAMDDDYHLQIKQKIPIEKLKFMTVAEHEEKQNKGAKMIDFVEHQEDMINLTKAECALIQIKTSPQGSQTFDLPDTLKRTTGPNKARKDSYSALVLGNWMIKVYYDMMDASDQKAVQSFTPMFIN